MWEVIHTSLGRTVSRGPGLHALNKDSEREEGKWYPELNIRGAETFESLSIYAVYMRLVLSPLIFQKNCIKHKQWIYKNYWGFWARLVWCYSNIGVNGVKSQNGTFKFTQDKYCSRLEKDSRAFASPGVAARGVTTAPPGRLTCERLTSWGLIRDLWCLASFIYLNVLRFVPFLECTSTTLLLWHVKFPLCGETISGYPMVHWRALGFSLPSCNSEWCCLWTVIGKYSSGHWLSGLWGVHLGQQWLGHMVILSVSF